MFINKSINERLERIECTDKDKRGFDMNNSIDFENYNIYYVTAEENGIPCRIGVAAKSEEQARGTYKGLGKITEVTDASLEYPVSIAKIRSKLSPEESGIFSEMARSLERSGKIESRPFPIADDIIIKSFENFDDDIVRCVVWLKYNKGFKRLPVMFRHLTQCIKRD